MKILKFCLILISGLAFSQQKPKEKLPEIKLDSLKYKLPELNALKKIDFKKPVVIKDSSLYKILNKNPENPELYSMLVKKTPLARTMLIPNSEKKLSEKELEQFNIKK
ncbi:hypothetical protein [uncultured Chryseobacterium sp.]|uniref:hypothetical protein n=1 Tax=uncultured Chryseobacterium sp. TaxID=259322 RepID=UPI0026385E71|nr:hypothetical protein [uncultured Chryseobacterium sp.]